jgi:hypothetical protein
MASNWQVCRSLSRGFAGPARQLFEEPALAGTRRPVRRLDGAAGRAISGDDPPEDER